MSQNRLTMGAKYKRNYFRDYKHWHDFQKTENKMTEGAPPEIFDGGCDWLEIELSEFRRLLLWLYCYERLSATNRLSTPKKSIAMPHLIFRIQEIRPHGRPVSATYPKHYPPHHYRGWMQQHTSDQYSASLASLYSFSTINKPQIDMHLVIIPSIFIITIKYSTITISRSSSNSAE